MSRYLAFALRPPRWDSISRVSLEEKCRVGKIAGAKCGTSESHVRIMSDLTFNN